MTELYADRIERELSEYGVDRVLLQLLDCGRSIGAAVQVGSKRTSARVEFKDGWIDELIARLRFEILGAKR